MKTNRGVQAALGLAIAGLAIVLTACSTAGIAGGGASYATSPYLIVDDATLARRIDLVSTDHQILENGLIRAHATFRSNRMRSQHVQYRFSWYDENGVEIDAQGQPFRKMILQGRDAVSVQSVAPNSRAVEYKVRLRR